MIVLEDIYKAQKVIEGVVLKTPIIRASLQDDLKHVYLKCENMQVTGSFKIRGALNKIANLSEAEQARGVIAWSAGNHAQGVAYATQSQNIEATICIPSAGSISKIEATKEYGAHVELCDGNLEDAMQVALDIKEKQGLTVIHPFDDDDVIAGQGTIGLEILSEHADVDAVIVPIGGGGLISGIAFAIKQLKPDCKVYGVEAENIPSMQASLRQDETAVMSHLDTIADGIAVKKPGIKNLEMVKNYVDKVITVNEDEILDAMLYLLEKNHLVVEGAGAAAFAAILSKKIEIKDRKVVCVISGGNIDVEILNRAMNKALINRGRLIEIGVEIYDRPGNLGKLIQDVATLKGNIIQVDHNRYQSGLHVNRTLVQLLIETIDEGHAKKIYESIAKKEYVLRWETKNYENTEY
ncbi:MAG TPA: threonine ammonia-lyase [Erysipelothrix sp.]|nr:threonine ammonia-lyase [Erysipelothrix sp.]